MNVRCSAGTDARTGLRLGWIGMVKLCSALALDGGKDEPVADNVLTTEPDSIGAPEAGVEQDLHRQPLGRAQGPALTEG